MARFAERRQRPTAGRDLTQAYEGTRRVLAIQEPAITAPPRADLLLACPAGGMAFGPRGVPHAFQNIADEPGRLLIVATPSGREGLFQDFAGRLRAGSAGPDTLSKVGLGQGRQIRAVSRVDAKLRPAKLLNNRRSVAGQARRPRDPGVFSPTVPLNSIAKSTGTPQKTRKPQADLRFLGGAWGLEPVTPCLQSRCATNCAKAPGWAGSGLLAPEELVGRLGPEGLLRLAFLHLPCERDASRGECREYQYLLHRDPPIA